MIKIRSDFLQVSVDWIVGNAEHILIRATPILAPLPSAFALAHALQNAQWAWAGLVGGIIESVGVAAGAMIAYISAHNERYPGRQIDQRIGYGLFGFYVFVAAALIFGFETLPALTDWRAGLITDSDLARSAVPLLFPGLTLIGAVIVALREYMRKVDAEAAQAQSRADAVQEAKRKQADAEFDLMMDIKRREAEQRLELQRLQAEQRMEIERQKAEAKLAQPLPQPVAQPPQPTATKAQRLDDLLRTLSGITDPGEINKAELGRQYEVSRQQIAKDIDELIEIGRLTINGKVQVHQ